MARSKGRGAWVSKLSPAAQRRIETKLLRILGRMELDRAKD